MPRPLTPAVLAALVAAACAVPPERAVADLGLPPATTQVLLVTTDDWRDIGATAVCLERAGDGWRQVGEPIAAQVGRSGLGWGVGLHRDGDGPTKREGDGRAPAGVFAIGPAFGYADAPPAGVTLPYRAATARDYFVDDPQSPDYNQWRRIPDGEPNDPAQHWGSCERMRRDDLLYEYGAVVGHNAAPPIAGRGSAIFLHVWSGPGAPTAGCTSMAKDELLRVLRWLRPDAAPVLVQVPRDELPRLRLGSDGAAPAGEPGR